jgi:glycosyltransferase involved in cell wall biosynthesis
MHILFFSHYFPPEGNAPASRTYENCKRWVNAGHEVTVITGAPNVPNGVVYEGYKNSLSPQREMVDGIKLIRIWTFIAANKGTVRRIINFLSYMFSSCIAGLILKKPDVVIATSPQFFCGWTGTIVSTLRRLPFILEIRDIWPESIVAVGAMNNKYVLRILEWLEIQMYFSADHIVTVGEGYKAKLLEKGVAEKNISIVPNGVDEDVFTPRDPDKALIKQLGIAGNFVCSFVGTIGMASGLDIIIRAALTLRKKDRNDIVFLIVGDGAIRIDLESKVNQFGLNSIFFTGRMDKLIIPNYLSITDVCLVHLKKTDLFKTVLPSKIFEAAGMAKPIILGVSGFAAKIVQDADAGIIIEPENDEQLVQALEILAENPQKCKKYGVSGYAYVTKHFNRNNLALDYLSIISTLLHHGD